MIILLQETSSVIALLDERGLTDQVMQMLPTNKTAGAICTPTESEQMYIIKFASEDDDDAWICMHLVRGNDEETAKVRQWFYSFIDPASLIGGAGEDFQA